MYSIHAQQKAKSPGGATEPHQIMRTAQKAPM